MSTILEATISLKVNGHELRALGFPLTARMTVDEFHAAGPYEEANDALDTTFSALPVGEIDSVRVFFLQALDQAIGQRLEGGEAGNTAVRLNAGGFIFIFNATGLTDTNLTINNNSGVTAQILPIVGGT